MNIGPSITLRQLNEEVQERIQWDREMRMREDASKVKTALLIGSAVAIMGTLSAIVIAGPGTAAVAAMIKCAPLVSGAYAMMAGAGVASVAEKFSGKFRRALDQAREAITGVSILDDTFQKHAHRVPEDLPVYASQSDFGLTPKDRRGIVAHSANLPDSLHLIKTSVERFASRLGINLAGSIQDVAKQAEMALRARATVAAQSPTHRAIPSDTIAPSI